MIVISPSQSVAEATLRIIITAHFYLTIESWITSSATKLSNCLQVKERGSLFENPLFRNEAEAQLHQDLEPLNGFPLQQA